MENLDLSERRKRYTSSREEEKADAQRYPCGRAIESCTHIAAECGPRKEGWGVLMGRGGGYAGHGTKVE